MKKIIFPAILSILLLTGIQGSAQIYIAFDGIEGESSIRTFKGATELSSFSMGASNSTSSTGSAINRTAGKVSMSDISFTKQRGVASSLLQLAVYTGRNIPTAEIRFHKPGMPNPYLVISLENVMITSWNISTPADKTGSNLTESFSLSYGKIKSEDVVTNPDGSTKRIPVIWDVARNISM